MLNENKIYLASKSPRRRELLHQVGIEFDLLLLRDAPPRGPDVTELVLPGEFAWQNQFGHVGTSWWRIA